MPPATYHWSWEEVSPMATAEPVVLDASEVEDEKELEGAEPIVIRAPGLPKLPPLTVEQAQELWEELSQVLAS
jgi:hypothetical protein